MRMKSVAGVLLALWFVSGSSQALMLGKTRVVVYQDKASTPLMVMSGENDPLYLIRSQVSRTPDSQEPVRNILVTPPLFRLDKGGRSQLRLSAVSGEGLPADRESRFYLKVAGIPSTNPLDRNTRTGFTGGAMLVGTGNIIKVFYRPHGMGAPDQDSYNALVFSRVPGGVQVSNPTPWYVMITQMSVDGHPVKFTAADSGELAPMSHRVFGTTSRLKKDVKWTVLNDAGNAVSGHAVIQ